MGSFSAVLVYCLLSCYVQGQTQFTLEMEDAAGLHNIPDRTMSRTNASRWRTLLLYENEDVGLAFCLPWPARITVANLYYSNDGGADNVTLFLDGSVLDTFETVPDGDGGHNWDVIRSTGQLGSPRKMRKGVNWIWLVVMQSDRWGVELDAVEIDVELPGMRNITEEEFFCVERNRSDPQRPDISKLGMAMGFDPVDVTIKPKPLTDAATTNTPPVAPPADDGTRPGQTAPVDDGAPAAGSNHGTAVEGPNAHPHGDTAGDGSTRVLFTPDDAGGWKKGRDDKKGKWKNGHRHQPPGHAGKSKPGKGWGRDKGKKHGRGRGRGHGNK